MKQHDLARQLEYIQQLLSQNKNPIGFLFGTGCPLSIRVGEGGNVEPLIPDVSGLKKTIDQHLTSDKGTDKTWNRLKQIMQDDGVMDYNIEQMLTKIRELNAAAGNGEVRGLRKDEIVNVESSLCRIILEQVDKILPQSADSPYHKFAIWCREIERASPINVFTTNYDLLFEQAFEESSAPYFDGFVGSKTAFFDLTAVDNDSLLAARWIRLWKMHGSINWRLNKDNNVVRTNSEDKSSDYLIFPSHLKYDQSRKMPYLTMLDRLQNFLLKKSSVMFVCGYSFGDEHINDVIKRCLKGNASAMVFALMFGKISDGYYTLATDCASKASNLSLIGQDGGIIGREFAEWNYTNIKDTAQWNNLVNNLDSDRQELIIGDFGRFAEMLSAISGSKYYGE